MAGTTPVLALACAVCLLPASIAEAKAPPRGAYDCVIGSNSILFGTLKIKAERKYSHRGSKGKYVARGGQVRFSDGVVGYKIRFKKGGLAGMQGRWYKGSDGTPQGSYEIALRNPRDDFESIYCTKRK